MGKLDDALNLQVEAIGSHGKLGFKVNASREVIKDKIQDLMIEVYKEAKGEYSSQGSEAKRSELEIFTDKVNEL